MKTIKLARVFREGIQNFYRDKWLTLATVIIMSLALYLVGVAVFLGFGILHVIDSVEGRINVSMYFDFTVPEEKILEIKKQIEDRSIEQIQSITYISRDQAMQDFLAREGDSEEIKEALDMIGENPLPASLVIVAYDAAAYESINAYAFQEYADYIMDTSFAKNKAVIDEIHNLIILVRNIGLILGGIFAVIAILVTLNTIRMSLYAHRQEFEIMRLVGASNLYIKMPPLVEGVLYGLTSAIISSILLVITVFALAPFIKKILDNVDVSSFYGKDIIQVVILVIIGGTSLGLVSSYIAIHRYLER
ncbi:MAG: permease-like cell division protein FtsX [Parcubacteria group bacterium]|jgi:cell division transport system permease protein